MAISGEDDSTCSSILEGMQPAGGGRVYARQSIAARLYERGKIHRYCKG